METINNIDKTINATLVQYVRRPIIIRGIVHLLLVLYATRLAPSLPKQVLALFENTYFKLFVFSMVLWTAQFSPSTSILIALGFMISVNYATQKPLWEFLENTENTENTETDPLADPVAPSNEIAVDVATTIVENQDENPQMVDNIANKQSTVVIQPTVIDTPQGPTVIQPNVVIAPAVVMTSKGEKLVVEPVVTTVTSPKGVTVAATAPSSLKPKVTQSGCYPMKMYDMSKVYGMESGDFSNLETVPESFVQCNEKNQGSCPSLL